MISLFTPPKTALCDEINKYLCPQVELQRRHIVKLRMIKLLQNLMMYGRMWPVRDVYRGSYSMNRPQTVATVGKAFDRPDLCSVTVQSFLHYFVSVRLQRRHSDFTSLPSLWTPFNDRC